jgi:RNA polymerase sigma-70 factor (ECF subfamily)
MCSEEHLVDRAKGGDELALVELWARHGKTARSAIWRITNSYEDTEDLLQETFMKSHLHLNQFDERSKFSTWLIRIAINSAFMLIRKRRRRREVLLTSYDSADRIADFVDESENIEVSYLRAERVGRLRVAVCGLKPSLRQVVELRHELDLSVEEIADKTGLSIPAVKARLVRARVVLGRALAGIDTAGSSAA